MHAGHHPYPPPPNRPSPPIANSVPPNYPPPNASNLPAHMQNMSLAPPPPNGHAPTPAPPYPASSAAPPFNAHRPPPARPAYPTAPRPAYPTSAPVPTGPVPTSEPRPAPGPVPGPGHGPNLVPAVATSSAAAPPQQQYARPYPTAGMAPRPSAMRPAPAAVPARPYAPQPDMRQPHGAAPAPAQQPAQPQLTTSMMPRPASTACGQPRPYYHRGMAAVSSDRPALSIPNANSDFISVDDGSARLRFARLTTNAIASEPNVMTKTGVPLALVTTPFANIVNGEAPIPVVDYSNRNVGGPLRCERCNGYCNPAFKFLNGGAEFQCNLCGHVNKTPQEHFAPVSHMGQRVDLDTRHELRAGSVEYIVGSSDYWIRTPKPPRYLFVIDVSSGAISSGLASAAVMSIKSALSASLLPGSNDGARVGIIAYDKALHFFDGRGADMEKSVTMQSVPDIMDPFVPVGGDALFLTPAQAVCAVDTAIENFGLASGEARNPDSTTVHHDESALGSALQAIKQAFSECGGKAFVISGSLPNAGVQKLERRGGGAMGGGEEREMALLKEANSSYDILGCELAEVQATVDLFLAPSSVYIDAATLSRVPRACGGRMHLFTGFDPIRDGASLHRTLCTSISEPRAFESLMRVRTSPGLEAKGEFVGHFARPQRGDDVAGPVMDASTTLALELSVTSKLRGDNDDQNRPYAAEASLFDDACVQIAILFTDVAGRRRIRVHSVFAKKTTVLSEVFSHADVDATAAFLAKKVASAVLVGGTTFAKAWEAVTEKTAQMFYVYRKHCTTSPVSGQLILPESYKVLPVMMLGLIKSAALRKTAVSMQSGDAVTIDERAAALSFLISGTMAEIAALCYPRLWEIQKLDDAAGVPLPDGKDAAVVGGLENGHKTGKGTEPISLPNTLPLSSESLTDDRILLLENGMQMVVWIGGRVDPAVVQSIVAHGVGGRVVIRGETASSMALLKEASEDGKRVGRIIQRIVSERKGLSRPQVVQRNQVGSGEEMKWVIPQLVEDRGAGGAHSYVEYLKAVHKRVMEKMSNDSAQSDLQTWEMLNHGY